MDEKGRSSINKPSQQPEVLFLDTRNGQGRMLMKGSSIAMTLKTENVGAAPSGLSTNNHNNKQASNSGGDSAVVVDARMHETATTLVKNLANLCSGISNRTSGRNDQQALAVNTASASSSITASTTSPMGSPPHSTPSTVAAAATPASTIAAGSNTILSSMGTGIISGFRVEETAAIAQGHNERPNSNQAQTLNSVQLQEDATEAAVKAVQDAMERAGFLRMALSGNPHVHLHIRLGVPGKLSRPSDPMHVNLSRLTSLLPQAIPVRRVEVVVGGLMVDEPHLNKHPEQQKGNNSGQQDFHYASMAVDPARRGTCAVVACLSLQQDVPAPSPPPQLSPPKPTAESPITDTSANNSYASTHGRSDSLLGPPTTWAEVEEQMKNSPPANAKKITETGAGGPLMEHTPLIHQAPPATLVDIAQASNHQRTSSAGGIRRADDFHRSTSMDMLAHISVQMQKQDQPDRAMNSSGKSSVNNSTAAGVTNYNYKKLPPGVTTKKNKRLFVQHNYKDHSQEVPTADELALVQPGAPERTPSAAFPLKLHEILSDIERDGLDNIIGWLPHGRCFKIHNQKEFVEKILPKYFVMTKKSSFLRQLNLYGFNRLSGVGPDQGSYYHEKFLRGMKFLSRRMMRQKVNGNGIRAAGNPDKEPVLSRYPTCPPIPLQGTMREQSFTAVVNSDSPHHRASSTASLADLAAVAVVANSVVNNPHAAPATKAASTSSTKTTTTKATPEAPDFVLRTNGVSFPLKLQRILDKLEADGNTEIISWLPHGRGFMVYDPDRFVSDLMPVYFNQTKFSSFQRQLHMYAFQRITAGPDKGAYHHTHFLRGQPQLSLQMQRTRVNGKGTRRPGNPMAEPNFSQLAALPRIAAGTKIDIPVDTSMTAITTTVAAALSSTARSAGFASVNVGDEENQQK